MNVRLITQVLLILLANITILIGIDILAFYFIKYLLYENSFPFLLDLLPVSELWPPAIILCVSFVVIYNISNFILGGFRSNRFCLYTSLLLGLLNSGLLIRFLWYNTPEFNFTTSFLFFMTASSLLIICISPYIAMVQND